MSTETPKPDLKSKNCPYCDAPRSVSFMTGDLIEHQCGTTRQKRTLKTVKQSGECLWRVHAAKLTSELTAARERIAELEKGITQIKAGTRIGWFMTDLGAKCEKLLNL